MSTLDETFSSPKLNRLRTKVQAICTGDDDFWLDFRASLLLQDSFSNAADDDDDESKELSLRNSKEYFRSVTRRAYAYQNEKTTSSVLQKASCLMRRLSWVHGLAVTPEEGELLVDFPDEHERLSIRLSSFSGPLIRSQIFSNDGDCDDSSFLPGANEDLTWAVGLSSPASSFEIPAASTFGQQRLFRRLAYY
jgi:hypothetical protein